MFIRKKRVKGRIYWYLVRSIWQAGKARQKVVGYCGKNRPTSIQSAKKIISTGQKKRQQICETERILALPVADFYAYLETRYPISKCKPSTYFSNARLVWETARMKRKRKRLNRHLR